MNHDCIPVAAWVFPINSPFFYFASSYCFIKNIKYDLKKNDDLPRPQWKTNTHVPNPVFL